MQNVEMSIDKNILIIKVDLTKRYGPSKSGKTEIIATTAGNVNAPEQNDVKIGLNVYSPIK
jgi:hypothetical protein